MADVKFEIAIEEDKESEIIEILKNKGNIEYLRTEEIGM